jgi:GntR family transcriptional regulator
MSDPPVDSAAPGVPLGGPLYRDVKRQLMEALTRSEWRPGEAIPAERRLSERYGISIGTVRKAIDELVAENILIRQQGRGTFVASHNRDRLLFYFFHIVPESGPKEYPEVRLLSFARARADRMAAEKLALEVGDPVYRIRNLLRLAGKPVIVDDITLPAARFAGLSERQFRDRPSTIYNLYQEAFGVSVVRTSERLRATLADGETAALLGVPKHAPLLQIRRVALTYNDVPVEFRVSLVDTERYEYFSDIGRT